MEMRRKDRKLSNLETIEILEKGEYGIFSTVGEDGMPYGVPMSYAYADGAIYMHSAYAEGYKILNIKHNPKASFTVVASTELLPESFATRYMSAIAFGQVELVSGEEKKKGLLELVKKYSPDFMEKGLRYIDSAIDHVYVIKLAVEEVSGKGRKV